MLKRLLIAVALIAGLTACGTNASSTTAAPAPPAPTVTVTATPAAAAPTADPTTKAPKPPAPKTQAPKAPSSSPTVSTAVRTVLYLQLIRKHYPALAGVSDSTLTTFAHNACAALEAGKSFTDLIDIAIAKNMSTGMVGYMIGSGVAAFCPSQSSKVHG